MMLLRVNGLKVYYHTDAGIVRAVDNVSFDLQEGETLGIAGESGCGKTTLAHTILGLLKPPGSVEEGKILFGNIDLLKLKHEELRVLRGKEISFIPQNSMHVLNPVITIQEQIADIFQSHEQKSTKAEMEKRVIKLLNNVGLSYKIAKMYPHELSGGMRQRVVIAISTALNPKLIIADEPTTALDVVVQRGIMQLMIDLKENLSLSVILITHDMGVQAQMANKICIMYAGKINEVGPVSQVFKDPLHPYSRMLISSIPSFDKNKELAGISGTPPLLINPPPGCRFHPRCPLAKDVCRSKPPKLIEIVSKRFVSCHLYGDLNE